MKGSRWSLIPAMLSERLSGRQSGANADAESYDDLDADLATAGDDAVSASPKSSCSPSLLSKGSSQSGLGHVKGSWWSFAPSMKMSDRLSGCHPDADVDAKPDDAMAAGLTGVLPSEVGASCTEVADLSSEDAAAEMKNLAPIVVPSGGLQPSPDPPAPLVPIMASSPPGEEVAAPQEPMAIAASELAPALAAAPAPTSAPLPQDGAVSASIPLKSRELVIDGQRKWLNVKLEQGIQNGVDSPVLYSPRGNQDIGMTGLRAASLVQAWARGRQCRLKHGDALQTAAVVRDAHRQVRRIMSARAASTPMLISVDCEDRTVSWRAATSRRMTKNSSVSSSAHLQLLPVPLLNKLARSQHWRCCPFCLAAVVEHDRFGSSQCTECLMHFRWARAALYKPTSSFSQLCQEVKWEHMERLHDLGNEPPTWRDVAKLYWLDSDRANRTAVVAAELSIYRSLVLLPLATLLPALTLLEQRRHSRRRQDQTRLQVLTRQRQPDKPPTASETEIELPRGGLKGPYALLKSMRVIPKTSASQAPKPTLALILPPAGAPPSRRRVHTRNISAIQGMEYAADPSVQTAQSITPRASDLALGV